MGGGGRGGGDLGATGVDCVCSGQQMWWTAMVEMDQNEAVVSDGSVSACVAQLGPVGIDSRWIDSTLPLQSSAKEVVVVCTADPLQRICHFQGPAPHC